MFLYENSNGELFKSLKSLNPQENETFVIFPVYIGHNNNLNSEEIIWKDGKFSSSDPSSWLQIKSEDILEFDLEYVLVNENKFFHCREDLIEYFKNNDGDYLPIKDFH